MSTAITVIELAPAMAPPKPIASEVVRVVVVIDGFEVARTSIGPDSAVAAESAM